MSAFDSGRSLNRKATAGRAVHRLFIAALWLSGPSFQKCSALENATERHACYDALRNFRTLTL
jgi:hypothetical protein